MLTRRGSSFFLVVVAVLGSSLWTGTPSVVLIALTLLLWFLASWALFQLNTIDVLGKLRIIREVADLRHAAARSLWAGRVFEVSARLLNDSKSVLPYVRIQERMPAGLTFLQGTIHAEGPLKPGAPLELCYRIACQGPGVVRFEGLTLQIADFQGFFYRRMFIQDVHQYRVLPAVANARGHFPTIKRHNLLPLIGAHRHRRPGTGSELLDLRDYMPGDPPKMIAWKPSARRDRLMTKEFESEVPIRCTLLVDTSNSVRVGLPGQNALTREVEIVAAITQANSAARDLTGLCLFDEQRTHYVKPARGRRHLTKIYELLSEAAALAPATGQVAVGELLPVAHRLAFEVYPQLLDPDLNRFPWWLPFWSPQPAYTLRRPPLPQGAPFRRSKQLARYAADAIRQNVFARLAPGKRKEYRWRKELAAILSARYGNGPGMLALHLEDDELFVVTMQRFLNEHRVPFEMPLYGPQGEYLFAAPAKVAVLAEALRQVIGRGRDNELFVLLADLLEIADRLDPVLAAVKLAMARHHAVLVVCPWPPKVPPPDASGGVLPLHRAYSALRHSFAKLGVPVACARHDETVPLILNRLERLRVLQRGVR